MDRHPARPTSLHAVTINGRQHFYTERFGPYRAEDGDGSQEGDPAPADPAAPGPAGESAPQTGPQPDAPTGDQPAEPPGEHGTPAGGGEGGTGGGDAHENSLPEAPAVAEEITNPEEHTEELLREQYAGLDTAAQARIDAGIETDEGADEVVLMRLAQDRIVQELNRRREAAAQTATRAAEAAALEVPALPDAPAVPEGTAVARAASAAQVAGARPAQTAAAREGGTPGRAVPRVAMLATAASEIGPAGSEMGMLELGEALDRTRQAPEGYKAVLASVPGYEAMIATAARTGEDPGVPTPLSTRNGPEVNDELIRETQDAWRAARRGDRTRARTAAICDPLDPIREIPSAFTDEERVSPAFPSRPIGRLGFQFTPSLVLADLAGSSRVWKETDQAAVDPTNSTTWKPIKDVVCGSPTPARAEAVTYGIRYDDTTEMSSPERIANAMAALQAVRARTKEGNVLRKLDATLSAYTYESDFGAVAAFIDMVNSLVVTLPYANRLEEAGFTMIIPAPLVAAFGIDIAKKANAETDVPSGDILNQLTQGLLYVNSVVQALDPSDLGDEPGVPPNPVNPVGNAPIPVPEIDGTYRVRLFDPSGYIYGETGQINVGTLRDSQTVRQNKTIFFGEEYYILAKNGPQPGAKIDVNICASGQRSGNLTAVGCNPPT